MADTKNEQKSAPSLFTILGQVADGVATRLQIASIEFSVAKNNASKALGLFILAFFFGFFALAFISLALLIIFWEDHRIFVSCALAGTYAVIFLFIVGRARNYAANLPYAFTESKQILQADANSLRNAFNRQSTASAEESSSSVEDGTTKESPHAGK